MPGNWTARVPLPGGDFPHDGVAALTAGLRADYPFLSEKWAARLVRAYGTEARQVLGPAKTAADLGRDFGATLTEAEVRWQMTREYARGPQDVLWRRTKLGLRLTPAEVAALAEFMEAA
jgi:glycerol-3-phosphate dehydrogenase